MVEMRIHAEDDILTDGDEGNSRGRNLAVARDLGIDAISTHDRRLRSRVPSPKEIRDLFADFSAIKVSAATMELRVRCPWDREMVAAIEAIPGSFYNAKSKVWHLRMHAWEKVLALAPRIQILADRAWEASFIEGAHMDGDDLRIVVPETRQANYPLNGLASFEGAPYLISHVGKPYLQAGQLVCNVYLILLDRSEEALLEGRAVEAHPRPDFPGDGELAGAAFIAEQGTAEDFATAAEDPEGDFAEDPENEPENAAESKLEPGMEHEADPSELAASPGASDPAGPDRNSRRFDVNSDDVIF